MAKYSFGSGQIFTTPVGGGIGAAKFGAVQDVSVDFSADIKMLYGQNQFPLAMGRGKAKIDIKFGAGQIDVDIYNSFYFGGTVTTGETLQAVNEAGTVPASTAYTVTVANAVNFSMDLGVFDVLTGLAMKRVASNPVTGQYSVNESTGVYTFAAADASKGMLFNYLWRSTTTGRQMVMNNALMGDVPAFQIVLSEKFRGKTLTMILYSCVSDKLSLPLKQDDFAIADISASAQANDAGNVFYMSHS